MDLNFTDSENAFRQECRAWLEANVPRQALPSGDTKEGFSLHLQWEHKLFDAGWAAVSWPKQYGGREATLFEWLIFEEEYYRVGAPSRVTQNGIFLLAPTLFEFGTDEQKERILRPMARGDVAWGQAWSEPNAGSDLASLKSTARRVEGGWRLSGQKTWSTRAAFCDMAYGLFRTDPEQTRHRGLTYFMFPLDGEGITVRGVDRLDGDEGFAEIFLEDVFVSMYSCWRALQAQESPCRWHVRPWHGCGTSNSATCTNKQQQMPQKRISLKLQVWIGWTRGCLPKRVKRKKYSNQCCDVHNRLGNRSKKNSPSCEASCSRIECGRDEKTWFDRL